MRQFGFIVALIQTNTFLIFNHCRTKNGLTELLKAEFVRELCKELVENAALDLEPHRIIFFLMDLAGQFHSYYNSHMVISDDRELTQARLWLAEALRIVFHNGLRMVGLSAPESM